MELRHLRYFVAVAEEENVTRAAARLHVSQPPLSRQIRDLEEELGVELFERAAKSIRLTEAGRVFLAEARAVLERAKLAEQTVKALGGGLSGELNVGYAPSLTVDILPRALRRFQAEAPKIRVNLHDLSTEEMLVGLRKDKLDLAMLIDQPARALAGLEAKELFCYSVSVAVSPAHPLGRKKYCALKDLAGERLIGYAEEDYPEYRARLAELPWPSGKAPAIAEAHDSVTSLIAAVEAGRGVAIAPESLRCLAGPRLKLLPLKPQPEPFRVIAAWRKLNAKSRRFLEAAGEVEASKG